MRRFLMMLLLAANVGTVGAQPRPDIYALLGPRGYQQPDYITPDRDRAPYVFVAGEPVHLNVMFKSGSETTVTLQQARAGGLAGLVDLALYRLGANGGDRLEQQLTMVESAKFTRFSADMAVPLTAPVDLLPNGLLTVGVRIEPPLDSGFYELRLEDIAASCRPPCRLIRQSTAFAFEIRSVKNVATRLEELARRARVHLWADELNEAAQLIAEIHQLHSSSVIGHQLSAELYEKRGDAKRAYDHCLQALALLRAGSDGLLNDRREPAIRQARERHIEERAQRLRVRIK